MTAGSGTSFIAPPPVLSPDFEWMSVYDELLAQIATTNVVDADWPILRDMTKYKLSEVMNLYLLPGPPWPLTPEDAYVARGRAFESLDLFTGPPFTIQRLCELLLNPFSLYSTLPKFLRAVTRVLSVTSDRAAFTEGGDDFDFNYANNSSTILSHDEEVAQGVAMSLEGGEVPTRRPTTSSARASAESSPLVIPLLSPIPWLIKTTSDNGGGEVELLHLNPLDEGVTRFTSNQSPPRNIGVTSSSSLSPPSSTMTPTGGLVDEVDPGSGKGEIVDPIALTGSANVGGGGLTLEGAREDGMLEVNQRFVRASSPRPEESEAVE